MWFGLLNGKFGCPITITITLITKLANSYGNNSIIRTKYARFVLLNAYAAIKLDVINVTLLILMH
jgi:hypothetical protein